MKKVKRFIDEQKGVDSLLFCGCRWSMFITAYALIAIIIVLSSEKYFQEGIYAAPVETIKKTFLFEPEETNEASIAQTSVEAVSSQAVVENTTSNTNTQVQALKAEETEPTMMSVRVNQNQVDSVKAEQDLVEEALEESKEVSDATTAKDSVTEKAEAASEKADEATEAFAASNQTSTKIKLSSKETEVLQRIVEAEATGETIKGKMLVANVVLNRVNSSQFPDTVEGVVFQKNGSVYQFSPVLDGRYYEVNVSSETKEAVNRVLNGEDESKGALYFMSRSTAVSSNVTWFDTKLSKVLEYGSHEFYK